MNQTLEDAPSRLIFFAKKCAHQKNEKKRTERAALANTALLGVNVRL